MNPSPRHTARKATASLLMLALVLPALAVPRHASAQWITWDVPNSLFQSVSSVAAVSSEVSNITTAGATAVSAGADVENLLQNWVLKPLAMALAKAAIQSITTSTVNWINGGFEGSPAFETNFKTSMRQLGDGVAQNFLTNLAQSTKINSPFVDSLITNVGAAYYLYSSRDALAARLQDTLSTASQNPAAFRAGNFEEGGWNAWFETFSNPANNPIGANMIASQALAEDISSAINQRTQELAWGNGFRSWRGDCIRTGTSQTNGGVTVTTGVTSTTEGGVTVTNGGGASSGASDVTLNDAEGCLEREIVTPGSFIENKLNISSDSPLRQLELAQSIDAIVGALAQQLITKALGGNGGLRGTSNPTQGGGSPATTQGTNTAAAGLVSSQEALLVTMQTALSQVTAWRSDSQTILTAANAARAKCVSNPVQLADPIDPAKNAAEGAVTQATAIIAKLNELIPQLQNSPTGQAAISNADYLRVSSEFEALNIPNTFEMQEVNRQAQDSGTSVIPTLYTKLNALATSNCVPFDPKNP